jgi:mannose-1-phosphate guanylyltransferase
MFLWRRRAILDALRRYAPRTLDAVEAGLQNGRLADAYETLAPADARSIDYAVMEPAAAAGQVAMGTLALGWSDIGSWGALLEALGAAGVAGRVVEAGEAFAAGPDDLVVRRVDETRCVAGPGSGATMTADAPLALLSHAGPHRAQVDSLLERCAAGEARS